MIFINKRGLTMCERGQVMCGDYPYVFKSFIFKKGL